jgi:hypothetical protein
MSRNDSNGPTDRSTPCDECGGGTYTFASGSIWCPAEDPHPGGHFVKRIAFEQSPTKTGVLPLPYPKRDTKGESVARLASRGSTKAKAMRDTKPAEPAYDMGMDGFVRSDT